MNHFAWYFYELIKHATFWANLDFWTLIVLTGTLFWVWRYTKATEKMLQNQMTPNVEANMLYEPGVKKTYFWFLNPYNIPALVTIIVTIAETNKEVLNITLRIPPTHPHLYEFRHTAAHYDFFDGKEILNGEEVTLEVITHSAMKNSKSGVNRYTKSYRFNAPSSRWDETTWGFNDPVFPEFKK